MTAAASGASAAARAIAARRGRDGGATPIVPSQNIAGRALTLVIAIMTLLAGLTVGAVTMVADAAQAWQSDLGSELTIEVRPVDGVDQAAAIAQAVDIAGAASGVRRAYALSDADTGALLEPWLGAGVDLAALPVPRLVVVEIGDPGALDVEALRTSIQSAVEGATLDDHNIWVDRLRTMAATMVVGGLVILGLVLCAMVLSVVFATRAAMAGNREIIEVLHFVGAEDAFVAREFQRHFLLLGIRGGIIGGALVVVVFAIGGFLLRAGAGTPSAAQLDAFIGGVSIGLTGYLAIAGIVVAVALLTAVTSRLAVRRSLAAIQ